MSRGLQLCASLATVWAILHATARADDAREVKPIATAKDDSRSRRIGSFDVYRDGMVIRSAEELVALTSKAKSAKEPEVQKEMETELAKLLKVEMIDWKKQTVVGLIGEKIDSLTTDGKVLTVTYIPYNEPAVRAIPPTPKILVLV